MLCIFPKGQDGNSKPSSDLRDLESCCPCNVETLQWAPGWPLSTFLLYPTFLRNSLHMHYTIYTHYIYIYYVIYIIHNFLLILQGLGREKEKGHLLVPDAATAQAVSRSPELNPGLPHVWYGLNCLSHHPCLSGFTLALMMETRTGARD